MLKQNGWLNKSYFQHRKTVCLQLLLGKFEIKYPLQSNHIDMQSMIVGRIVMHTYQINPLDTIPPALDYPGKNLHQNRGKRGCTH